MVKEVEHRNEWALVLGGCSGLGVATGKKLGKDGMKICVVHRSMRSQLIQIEKEFNVIKQEGVDFISYNSDATRPDNIAKLIENLKKEMQVGKIKTLVHSIAKGNLKPMVSDLNPELEVKDFQITIQAMGISLYDWVKAVFEAKLFSDDARVVSFTSEGNSKAWKNYAAVSAAKATLEVITRYVALEFARYGIRSNCIQAGVTDTASLRLIPANDEIKNHSLLRNPYARLTLPEDVANVVYLLSKDEASWINGTIIPVDGGEHIN